MYVLMGANGNITSKAAKLLRAQGKKVRVVGRDAARMRALKDAGVELAIGDAKDARFLADVFRGADGVYAIATQDVAAAVAKELVAPSYTGQTVKNLLGQRDVTMSEAARILGGAVGKPDLQYVPADPAQAKAGMVTAGFSQNVADLFEEMSQALSDGRIFKTYARDAASTTATSVEQFASFFAAAYNAGGH